MKLSLSAYRAPKKKPAKPSAKPRGNPRVACGTVSNKKNKFVGATIRYKGKTRKVVGCARKGENKAFYATRASGKKGTPYVAVKKRAVRDLKHRSPKAVKLAKHKGVTHTSAKLVAALEKRYAKLAAARKAAKKRPAKKAAPKARRSSRGARQPKGKLHGAAKAAFLKKMAAGRKAAARKR